MHVCPHFKLIMARKTETSKSSTKHNIVHVYKCSVNVRVSHSAARPFQYYCAWNYFSNRPKKLSSSSTKQPVSANRVEVLASPVNECVWCQRSVLCPSLPSVRRIQRDESQKKLKALRTLSLFALWKYMTAHV